MSGLYNNITVSEAAALQKQLRSQIELQAPANFSIHTIAGADISFNKYETTVYAGIIVLSFPDLQPIAHSLIKTEVTFPYVSGYLAFREAPALIEAWQQLAQKPDVLVVDGHGIAHPRRMGIASHFGVLTGQPTIGCAKKILFGKYEQPPDEKGAYTNILDKGEVLGAVLRTREKVKPVFVSPGHKLSLQDSINIILKCMGKYRIPEPTRRAHELVNTFRRGEVQEGYLKL
ncbi:MAG TPA: deoxyribonuclease V [Flavisolibacter sp.]|nr:deoxyribonuclease V [Flavisolibacter sp.]